MKQVLPLTRPLEAGFAGFFGLRGVLVLLLACLMLAGCGRTALYSDLNEQQANEMMAALLGAGIGAEKGQSVSKTGWEVRVSQGDFPKAMQVLVANRLPSPPFVSMCETFKKEGFVSSELELKARYQCSLQSEIAQTLSSIPGVAGARVHIAIAERDQLGNQANDSSAAVTIFERPGSNVRDRETDIKVMVKDSIEGLDDPNKVTVKFYTLGGVPQASSRVAGTSLSMASISPMAIGIGAGVLVLLAIAAALMRRLRSPAQQQPAASAATPVADGRLWKG